MDMTALVRLTPAWHAHPSPQTVAFSGLCAPYELTTEATHSAKGLRRHRSANAAHRPAGVSLMQTIFFRSPGTGIPIPRASVSCTNPSGMSARPAHLSTSTRHVERIMSRKPLNPRISPCRTAMLEVPELSPTSSRMRSLCRRPPSFTPLTPKSPPAPLVRAPREAGTNVPSSKLL